MKKLIALCGLAVGFVAFTAMQQPKPSPAQLLAQTQPEVKSKGVLKFEFETHDFGKIPHDKPVSVDFKFTNKGSEPLKLTDVVPTCGCTIADYTKTPVNPGGSGYVKLTYNAKAVGVFSKGITVKSNTEEAPVKMLYIKGDVQAADDKK